MSRLRLVLHVGSPKTGTTYLQQVLRAAPAPGLHLLPARRREAAWLMLDLRGRLDPAVDDPAKFAALDRFGDRLARLADDEPGSTVLLSEEQLGAAEPDEVVRLLERCAPAEVHVVVTARSLARSVASYWQQQLQAGATVGFDAYVEQVRTRSGDFGPRFWRAWDPTSVRVRWTATLPPDRFHVVTVPRRAAPDELLRRFTAVLGVAAPAVPEEAARPRNTGLGRVQAEVLRDVNALLPPELRRRGSYAGPGKSWLTGTHLAAQTGEPVRLPATAADWCAAEVERVVAGLATEAAVVGDLADLRDEPGDFAPEDVGADDAEVRAAAVRALASMVQERAQERADPAAAPPEGPRRGRRGPRVSAPRGGAGRAG